MVPTLLDENTMKHDDYIAEDKNMASRAAAHDIPEGKGHFKENHSNERLEADAENDDSVDDEPAVVLERVFTRRSMASRTESHLDHHHHQLPLTDLDKGIVGWDGPDDPENPLNFPRPRKWALLSLVAAITFVSPLASSMFAPAVGFLAQDFGVREELLLSFTVSVYLLGYVVSNPFLREADIRIWH